MADDKRPKSGAARSYLLLAALCLAVFFFSMGLGRMYG